MSQLSGKVQTVLGLVDPDQLGRTMTHEHLTMSFECCYFPPPACDEAVAENPFQLQHMHWLRQNPYSCRENLLLLQETSTVREELLAYRKAGGGTVVENTTTGIDRDLPTLRQLAKDTGVHVIAGAWYYVDCTHTEATKRMVASECGEGLRASLTCSFVTNNLSHIVDNYLSFKPDKGPIHVQQVCEGDRTKKSEKCLCSFLTLRATFMALSHLPRLVRTLGLSSLI